MSSAVLILLVKGPREAYSLQIILLILNLRVSTSLIVFFYFIRVLLLCLLEFIVLLIIFPLVFLLRLNLVCLVVVTGRNW